MAQALGHAVARRGGDVRFAKTSRVLSDLAGGHADRTWGQRIREYTKPLVLILDDFAMREHTAMHADVSTNWSATARSTAVLLLMRPPWNRERGRRAGGVSSMLRYRPAAF